MKNGKVVMPHMDLGMGSTVKFPAGDTPFPVPDSTVRRITKTFLKADDAKTRHWVSYILEADDKPAAQVELGFSEWRIINVPGVEKVPNLGVHFAKAAQKRNIDELQEYRIPGLCGEIDVRRIGAQRDRLFGTMQTYRLPNGILYVEKTYEGEETKCYEGEAYRVSPN